MMLSQGAYVYLEGVSPASRKRRTRNDLIELAKALDDTLPSATPALPPPFPLCSPPLPALEWACSMLT